MATVVLVLIANSFAFSGGSILSARIVLILALAMAAALGLALPLYGLNSRRTARKAENAFPQFNQRLLTFAERDPERKDPFMEFCRRHLRGLVRRSRATVRTQDVNGAERGVASRRWLWMIAAGRDARPCASLLWGGA